MKSPIYIHNLSPYLFHFQINGHEIGLHWYGLAYVLGFFCAYGAFHLAAKRGYLRQFDEDAQTQMIIAVILGVVVGGRLGFVVQHPKLLLSDPLFAIEVWKGGMAFFGGLIGVMLAMLWTAHRYQCSFWRLADIATFPAAFGLGVGRIANFVNGELWGRPTDGSWGVIFPRIDMLPRHPSQLYESASHFLLLGLLLLLAHYKPDLLGRKTGIFAALFLTLYGILRFLTDFYREDATYFASLSTGQWASLLVAIIGIGLLAYRVLIAEQSLSGAHSLSTNNAESTGEI